MKTLKLTILAPLLAAAAACNADTAELQVTAAETRSAAADTTCVACHRGERSFAGEDADELAARIRAILDGDVMHPPLGLEDTSEEAVAALAEALTAG